MNKDGDPTDSPSWPWGKLISRLASDRLNQQGSEIAWAELLRRLRAMAAGLRGRGELLFPSDSDDAVAEVIVRLQSSTALQRVARSRHHGAYLYAMLINASRDIRRRNQRRDREESIEPGALADPVPTALERLIREENEPDHGRLVMLLRRTLRRLSSEERSLIRQRFWEDRSIREIADGLGVPYATAATKIHRLLIRLRRSFKDTTRP